MVKPTDASQCAEESVAIATMIQLLLKMEADTAMAKTAAMPPLMSVAKEAYAPAR